MGWRVVNFRRCASQSIPQGAFNFQLRESTEVFTRRGDQRHDPGQLRWQDCVPEYGSGVTRRSEPQHYDLVALSWQAEPGALIRTVKTGGGMSAFALFQE